MTIWHDLGDCNGIRVVIHTVIFWTIVTASAAVAEEPDEGLASATTATEFFGTPNKSRNTESARAAKEVGTNSSPKDSSSKNTDPAKIIEDLQASVKKLEDAAKKALAEESEKKVAAAKKPTIQWTGQLQWDSYWFNQDKDSKMTFGDIENGTVFRRARFGMSGEYGPSDYRIEFDFALSGRPSFLDVSLGFHDLPVIGRIRFGHFFEPFSLERLTPNRFLTYMERALPDSPFVPARNTGIMALNTYGEKLGTWAVGVFRTDSDAMGDDVGDNFEYAVTGRVTWLPIWQELNEQLFLLHLGAGYSYRGANNETVRFRAQPEARLGAALVNVPFFADTGDFRAHSFQIMNAEMALVWDAFSIQGEYLVVPVDAHGAGSLVFSGWYVQVSYFITGEHRPYNRDTAAFSRIIPKRDFLRYQKNPEDKLVEFGTGAWEIAARVSNLDLDDETIRGGTLTNFTLGINWYLSPYWRVTANYVRAGADHPTDGKSWTDIFAVRLGFEF